MGKEEKKVTFWQLILLVQKKAIPETPGFIQFRKKLKFWIEM